MKKVVLLIFLLSTFYSLRSALGEDWPGYEKGGEHQNASSVVIAPEGLNVKWQKVFPSNGQMHCSRNLVLVDGKIALIGTENEGAPYPRKKGEWFMPGYISVINAADGKTLACYSVKLKDGQRHNHWYPHSMYVDSADTLGGHHVTWWDKETGNLFIRSGGDGCFATAFNLSNLNAPGEEGFLPGIPSFKEGRELPQWKKDPKKLEPFQWERTGPNNTSFFEVDSASPILVFANQYGHTQSGGLAFTDKRTGMPLEIKVEGSKVPSRIRDVKIGDKPVPPPFAKWAPVIITGNRICYVALADDNDGDGRLGNAQLCVDTLKKEPELEKDKTGKGSRRWQAQNPDQGLSLVAYEFKLVDDEKPVLNLKPLFVHSLHSPHKPEHGPADCESYVETDHLRRNKAFLADKNSLWAVWQKSKAVGAELVYADEKEILTWPLGICKGVKGQDVWPHISLAEADGEKYIAYYAGNAYRREYLDTEPPYRPVDCWGEQKEPGGPAQFAVFDIQEKKVAYTYDITPNHPSLSPNLALHYIDKSQMVCAGKWAYVGWIDLTGEKAQLRLLAFDITAKKAEPVEKNFSLDFESAKYSKSILEDLVAVDGRIYALVTQAADMAPDKREFDAQIIIALSASLR